MLLGLAILGLDQLLVDDGEVLARAVNKSIRPRLRPVLLDVRVVDRLK